MKHVLLSLTLIIVTVTAAPCSAVGFGQALSIDLIDEEGRASSIDAYGGYYRLVFFGYTFCPDICPLTLFYIGSALKSIGDVDDRLKVLFVSIDPKRDTPAVLTKYTNAFHPSLIGLTGEYDQIVELTKGFRTTFGYTVTVDGKERSLSPDEYNEISPDTGYTPFHSSQIYMLDPEGKLVDIIGYGSRAPEIAGKILEYIPEKK